MAKRGRSAKKEFEFKGFINLDFTGEEKKAISTWLEAFNPGLVDSVVVLVEAGYKIGFSYSDYYEAIQISATCKYAQSKYYGYCFTFVHSDPEKGIGVMRYVYDSLLAEELYDIAQNGSKFDW